MDKIIISDLEIYGYHGVFEEENKLGQRFLISAEIETDYRQAAKNDQIDGTINYGELCHELERVFLEENFNLIEAAAMKLARYILHTYEGLATSVTLTLKKPWAPIGKPINYAAVQVKKSWHDAYIAYGSNMGDRHKNIVDAKELLVAYKDINMVNESKQIETEPWGYVEQDDFLNGVWHIRTLLEPEELMDILLDIEKRLKRERLIKWGPRTLDLDILLVDDIVSNNPHVLLPHPRMHERMFVLEPLMDIAPYALHPLQNKRIFQLKEELDEKENKDTI